MLSVREGLQLDEPAEQIPDGERESASGWRGSPTTVQAAAPVAQAPVGVQAGPPPLVRELLDEELQAESDGPAAETDESCAPAAERRCPRNRASAGASHRP